MSFSTGSSSIKSSIGRLICCEKTGPECRSLRRECRRLERQYHRTCTAEHRWSWVAATLVAMKLTAQRGNSTGLSASVPAKGRRFNRGVRCQRCMLGRVTSATGHSADGFAKFIAQKVDDIRVTTAGVSPAPVVGEACRYYCRRFVCARLAEVRRVIVASPVRSCSFDAVPTSLIRRRSSSVSDSYGQCVVGSRTITSVTATCHRDTPPEKDRTHFC